MRRGLILIPWIFVFPVSVCQVLRIYSHYSETYCFLFFLSELFCLYACIAPWTHPHTSYTCSTVCKHPPFQGEICIPCIINLTNLGDTLIYYQKDLLMVPWGKESKKNSTVSFFIMLFEQTGGPSIDFPHFTPTKKTTVRLMSSLGATGRAPYTFLFLHDRLTKGRAALWYTSLKLSFYPFCVCVDYICVFSSFVASRINTGSFFPLLTEKEQALCSVIRLREEMWLIWSLGIIKQQIEKQSLFKQRQINPGAKPPRSGCSNRKEERMLTRKQKATSAMKYHCIYQRKTFIERSSFSVHVMSNVIGYQMHQIL